MMKNIFLVFISVLSSGFLFAQPFTHADTLRGSNGPGRDWWDATHYDLHVTFNISDSTISGHNIISYKLVKEPGSFFQIDLQSPLIIDSVIAESGLVDLLSSNRKKGNRPVWERKKLKVVQDGNAWFAMLDGGGTVRRVSGNADVQSRITVYYHGKPHVAKRAPWDGGLIWARDKQNAPYVTTACQGLGASVWYPCKDYQGDEPDSAGMHFTAPDTLQIVSNGRWRSTVKNGNGTHTVSWAVQEPINSYNITPYIGKYVHFGEVYQGESGPLTMDYWVLDSNLAKAKKQFVQAPMMIKAFEYWFGPYPFYKDGYKLIEAPHLGMEHQSGVAYGNHFMNGYMGRDLSGSGYGLNWDFIIVHESGHEWFGNNITSEDIADMWVHEGFTNYSETLFTEYFFGKEAAQAYVIGTRRAVQNDRPVVGAFGVQNEGSGDMYYKAGNMLHAIRQIINDDDKFRMILRGLNTEFRHSIVTGKQVRDYINEQSKMDFGFVFKQYLETIQIPVLEYRKEDDKLIYRWANCVDGFNMPVRIYNDQGELIWIYPADVFQAVRGVSDMRLDKNFFVNVKEVSTGR